MLQNPKTKRGKTLANVTLTYRIWHHLVRVVIAIRKLDEEKLRNGKGSRQCKIFMTD